MVGWLSTRHERGTRGQGGLREFRFRRENLAGLDILDQYAPAHDPGAARKMHRDVADLEEYGIELRFDPATDEWVSRAVPLSDRERRALAIAALSVAVRDPASPGRWYLPGAGITPQAAVLILSQGHLVDILLDAVRARRRVRLMHRAVPREVAPLGLTEVRGRWYLVAQDLERGERRIFGLDSVESAEPYGEAKAFDFGRVDLETAVEEIVDPDRWVDAEPVVVRLRVDQRLVERACRLLRARECGPADVDGWVPLDCTMRNRDAFLNRLFALRSRAVVEGPPEVRALVVARLRVMAEARG